MTNLGARSRSSLSAGNVVRLLCGLVFCFFDSVHLLAQTNSLAGPPLTTIRLVMVQGTVEVLRVGTQTWVPGKQNQTLQPGDRVRTGERSRAEIDLAGRMCIKKDEYSEVQIPPSQGPTFRRGLFEIFHWSRNRDTEHTLPGATAAVRGTEFLVYVSPDGQRSELTMLDGDVLLRTHSGELDLTNGERGIIESNGTLRKSPVIRPENELIQWSLYYPAVLNMEELDLPAAERAALNASLNAYRSGDLLQALALCSWETNGVSNAGLVYRAALLLAVGRAENAKSFLDRAGETSLTRALGQMMAVTKGEPWQRSNLPGSASEWLAESYGQQAANHLELAREAAQTAVAKAPSFGFAWERLAELEFGFGRTTVALRALEKSLALSPRNAEALALKGFLLSAQNKTSEAVEWFEKAISADSALANAWLGKGLCRIHQGHPEEGLRDLIVAASLEPQRSLLRSYLGKAFANIGDDTLADRQLRLATQLDPRDPTVWLYSALLKQQENRINQAVGDLKTSQDVNDNRSIFRSRLLLDEDRAVSSANLASVYRDLGMNDVSVREASRAVSYDYANDSAHLFLSDAYNDLRDPTRFNLRYETVWFNELLLANLLSPVGGGRLSQEVSQQEYSKLFEENGLGLASSTDARTDNMLHEQASQYGTFGNTAYSLDLDYQHNGGVRVNNGLDDIEWYSTVKQQVGPQDTALLLIKYENYHSGDNFQYYDQNKARPYYNFDETQHPIAVAGWHHEWAPGMHTLFLGGRLENEQNFSDIAAPQYLFFTSGGPIPNEAPVPVGFDTAYHNKLAIYTSELNQICEWDRVTFTGGARYQEGVFQTQDALSNPSLFTNLPFWSTPAAANGASDHFQRICGYGYLTIEPVERLWITGGVAYDQVTYPDDFRAPPISSGEQRTSQLGPKAAVVWNFAPPATLRAIYTRSLGGVSLDESFRLEPTQLAGFPQAFRSLISESIVGSLSAPTFDTLGVALDLNLGSRTFAGVQVERLGSAVRQDVGVFEVVGPPPVPAVTPEVLDYHEYVIAMTANQLLGDDFVTGIGYSFTEGDLHNTFLNIPVSLSPGAQQITIARLHEISGYLLFNHPSGFFAKAETQWYAQHNSGFQPAEPGDEFFQQNFYIGYRLARRRVEMMLGLLNIMGRNYKLDPLTVYDELPRKRVLEARLNFIF